ncbi:MAG: hypothetical protein AAFY84_00240 [Pseudomonadota bacterium]
MEVDQTALQQALLSQTTITVQTIAVLITAQITLFFGYFGALYLFLRNLGVLVRAVTFLFFALANMFLAAGHFLALAVNRRTLQWRAAAIENNQLPSYFTESSIESYNSLVPPFEVMYFLLSFGTVFFALYLTFFYPWKVSVKEAQ